MDLHSILAVQDYLDYPLINNKIQPIHQKAFSYNPEPHKGTGLFRDSLAGIRNPSSRLDPNLSN